MQHTRNGKTYDPIIRGYLKNGQPSVASSLLYEMQQDSIQPDQVTMSHFLKYYLETRQMSKAFYLYSKLQHSSHGIILNDPYMAHLAIQMYTKINMPDRALQAFHLLKMKGSRPLRVSTELIKEINSVVRQQKQDQLG